MIKEKIANDATAEDSSKSEESGDIKADIKAELSSPDQKSGQSDSNDSESPIKVVSTDNSSQLKDTKDSGPTWIDAICVVTFDLDEGQLVEYMLPSGALTSQDQKLLSLLSFPDSNAFGSEGFCKYVFSLKKSK